jgi:cysteine synthase A
LVDEFVAVNGAESIHLAQELARKEGIFCGISSGATFAGALEIAKDAPKGAVIVCMLPDTGERYLSTALFDGIGEDMDEDEVALSKSTPNFRFDVTATPKPADEKAPPPAAKPEALAFLEEARKNPDEPVVMFALEWCEFCWSVRKMFAEVGIPYLSIDLDSVEYQQDNKGGDIRAALLETIHSPTIPQIFVGGEYIGGATETFDAFNDGSLQKLLDKKNVSYDTSKDFDAYSFLPKWLAARG